MIVKESPISSTYLGSREGDPASLVENVSTIHGDYTEVEVDLTVSSPDSLVLSRFYSSRDNLQTANFGGWRFNPHCFLSIQKDPKGKSYTTAEGKFELTYVYVGNPDGTILTYVGWQNTTNSSKRSLFKIDPEGEVAGIANIAKGTISCWTNLKNNELYFDPKTNSFELVLCSEGKRFYSKHPSLDIYFITQEVLPSGNKIFYEFDEKGQLSFIKETNTSEQKVLAWIKIEYRNGIHIETSDGKSAEYHFQQDSSGAMLLSEVIRSDKPNLAYQYQVVENQALLIRKNLPEGHFVRIDYYNDKGQKNKVRSVTIPSGTGGMAAVLFSYGDDYTEVNGPGERKAVYRFDDDYQLVAIEQYLDGFPYRIHKKSWGTKSDAGNLISTSVEDTSGNVFYYKHFTYDSKDKGNIVEEREYGDVIGLGAISLNIDENGLVTNQDGHIKNYSYFSGKNTHGFFQTDAKGTGVKYWYKKGTNLLLKKFILTKGSPDSEEEDYRSGIKERHFYAYNDDASLVQVVVDDGKEGILKDDYGVTERTITRISPKQELPNVGAPEVIDQKYSSTDGKSEFLVKRTVNQFDGQGNIASQAVYDANENHCYTLTKRYERGLLVLETDPLGNETHYSYDGNQNLILETNSDTGVSIEYGYDLRNNLIYSLEKDRAGNRFETHVTYDPSGNKISEVDRFGNETIYVNDSLGRPVQITYPEKGDGAHSSVRPTYTYGYDLFDNPISVTDPKGRTLTRSYNVHGKPIEINHLNGTKEVFRYDSGGNLHHYYGADGLLQVFAYDYKGRLNKLEYFRRGSKSSNYSFKEITHSYGAFHKTSETDARGEQTTYTYGHSGRLATLTKDKQKVEFMYDSLGRTSGVKKWKSAKTFTLEIKEYDLLDRVVEERTEDQSGKVLLKKRYVYNKEGQLDHVIGYPQNKENVLVKYEYDGFGRLRKTTNAAGHATIIEYDDAYLNDWGQKASKRTLIDPMGNQIEEVFDVDNRLVKATKKDKTGQLLADTESYYDSLGNQIAQKTLVFSANAPSGAYETEWTLNQADQVESFTLGKGTPEERTLRYEYNSYGDIAAKYNHDAKEPITYRYDNEANLNTISYKEGKNEIEYKLSYDHHKNITEVYLDSLFTITYSFDAHDMPLTEKIKDEFGSYQVGRTYDWDGKIQTLQFPDGSFVEYFYEGPFVKGAKRFSKDKKELYSYQVASRDLMGNILEEILPGHLGGRNQTWDEAGRRIEISTDFFQDRVVAGGYDPLENIRKRETVLDDETYTIDYDYNALAQLILEKGEIEHKYSYDSIGNRLQRDGSAYKVDGVNQLIEAEGATYTFDPNGNLATKTVGTRTWTYQTNRLNQIVSITDPDQNIAKFTYDPSGKRLTKRIESKSKKAKIFRFFYLGDTEIGSVDEKGVIVELKIPGNPNNPEAPSIAIEIRKEIYVPLYDLQGNITCLLDPQRRKVVETYRYSVYGEEEIINDMGRSVSDSSVGNPWRYKGKRVDKEMGLMYFGYRYYDAQVGRWVSPDPLGAIDGPNLYAYARNNPMKYVDYFGLNSALDENCGCTQHGHPGWHNAPEGCVCICGENGSAYSAGSYRSKIGSDIKSAICGVSHGVVDFVVGSIHDLQTAATYMGAAELELSLQERIQIIEAVEHSQADQMAILGSWMMDMLSIDESDSVYHSFRSTTTTGLEIGSLIAGGYGAVKGVIAFNKLAKAPIQAAKLAKKLTSIERKGISLAGSRRAPLDYAPFQTVRNEATVINNRTYVGHALDRMQDRGFMPSVIENAIETGKVSPTTIPGRVEYYDPVNNLRVIVQDNERIISVIPKRSKP
jgi:RHS repeat-associated protein